MCIIICLCLNATELIIMPPIDELQLRFLHLLAIILYYVQKLNNVLFQKILIINPSIFPSLYLSLKISSTDRGKLDGITGVYALLKKANNSLISLFSPLCPCDKNVVGRLTYLYLIQFTNKVTNLLHE